MSKHMRLVVSVLFIVVIFLAIAITRSYSSTSRRTAGRSAQTDIEQRLAADSSGNRIFEDASGLFGVVDSSDRVIVPAEWRELSFAGDGICIASKRIGGTLLKGCVDYEGNVIVPFIYQSILPRESGGQNIYIAESGTDGSVIVYDSSFRPMFRKVWKKCEISGDYLVLSSDNGTYRYLPESSGIRLVRAQLSGEALGCGFSFEVKNADLLSALDPSMLEYMASTVAHYLGYAYTGDASYVSEVRTGGSPVFTKLFPEEKKILSRKLLGINGAFFYKSGSDKDGVAHYEVSLSASTEITYSADGDDQPLSLKDDYRAVVEFSGSSANDLTVVSGSFTVSEPTYPKTETGTEPETDNSAQFSGELPQPPEMRNEDGE